MLDGATALTGDFRVFQFIEAPAFSRHRKEYLNDDAFIELQRTIAANPEAGHLIPGAGGVRKLRWKDPRRGKGKRGDLRAVYYCFFSDEEIWLLTVCDKNQASDMTSTQKEQFRSAFEAERAARKDKDR